MDKVRSFDKVQSDMEAEKQNMKAETQLKGLEIQQKEPGK